jgi:hypothetical protein
MRGESLLPFVLLAVVGAAVAGACTTLEPTPATYFGQTIAPVLQSSCVRTNTGAGCHVSDTRGNAFGNLDVSQYTGIDKRRDLLLDYGPYLQPSLLVKNIPPFQVAVQLWDGTKVEVTTDIKHVGGPILDPTASGYQILRRWIENGATENNTGVPVVNLPRTPCTHVVLSAAGFDPTADPTTTDYPKFKEIANPILGTACANGNCHGTTVNALYLTCGQTPEEIRWNYFAAVDYLSATAAQSEIVRRPLATSQGGSYHEGGPLFASVNDPNYAALLSWATTHGAPQPGTLDPAFVFFAQKVQPILVKKGCMMAQCHSVGMFHDYRLRGGSAGSFSLNTSRRNYAFTIDQMSFESPDVSASRLVRKNLYRPVDAVAPGATGVTHRGGSLFEDFGTQLASGALCDQANYDYSDLTQLDTIPAYCVVRAWFQLEQSERNLAPLSEIAYVSRPLTSGPDRPQDFDVFVGGASLHLAPAALAPTGDVQLVAGGDQAVDLSTCGLGSAVDVRRPAASWDGQTIAFAARATATDPLAIYTIHADGTACTKQPDIAAHLATAQGLLEHDFDPTFSPPGPDGVERIVFASTRGNIDSTPFDYSGPQRTPEDPTKPNANLYVLEPTPGSTSTLRVRQLTWQLNMERLPSFMQDGRLVFTAEKREPGFYQLALRRQNLDGGDYHPLFAQRASIGFTQATYVVELADKNFATIFSNANAQHGAGSLAVFNRSLGIDFSSQTPSDYPIDPSVINPSSPSAPEPGFFQQSLDMVAADGSYTSPSPLPGAKLLVSFGTGQPQSFAGDYDVYTLDPSAGTKTRLLGTPGTAEVEAVAVYPRVDKGIFVSTPDEPNGHTSISSAGGGADVTVLDMRVLASLLFQNTPTGRLIENDLASFEIYEDLPPDVSSFGSCGRNTACDAYGKVYVRRRLLGAVPVLADGSAHFRVPGGLPMVLHLADDTESTLLKLPRWQHEEMTFLPGEQAHQAFPGVFFNNLCAGCHGSLSGRPTDAALLPDFLSEASDVAAVNTPATDYSGPPSQRGPVMGPPTSP